MDQVGIYKPKTVDVAKVFYIAKPISSFYGRHQFRLYTITSNKPKFFEIESEIKKSTFCRRQQNGISGVDHYYSGPCGIWCYSQCIKSILDTIEVFIYSFDDLLTYLYAVQYFGFLELTSQTEILSTIIMLYLS